MNRQIRKHHMQDPCVHLSSRGSTPVENAALEVSTMAHRKHNID